MSGQGYYPPAQPGMHIQGPAMTHAGLMAGAPMPYSQAGQFAGYGQQFPMQVPVAAGQPPATQQPPPPPNVTAPQTAVPPPPHSQSNQQQPAAPAAQQPPVTVAAGAQPPPGQPRPGPGQTPPFHQPQQVSTSFNRFGSDGVNDRLSSK